MQTALVAEIHLDVQVEVDGLEGDAVAQQRALESQARKEWDLVSMSAAQALKRHLFRRNLVSGTVPAVGLVVLRQVANESPELLTRELPEDGDGSA